MQEALLPVTIMEHVYFHSMVKSEAEMAWKPRSEDNNGGSTLRGNKELA
jgi:hypothetical protein